MFLGVSRTLDDHIEGITGDFSDQRLALVSCHDQNAVDAHHSISDFQTGRRARAIFQNDADKDSTASIHAHARADPFSVGRIDPEKDLIN